MRNIFVTLRFGADTRARVDLETLELHLVTDTNGEFAAVVIAISDAEHVMAEIRRALEVGKAAIDEMRKAAAPAVDNVTPFKRPGDGE